MAHTGSRKHKARLGSGKRRDEDKTGEAERPSADEGCLPVAECTRPGSPNECPAGEPEQLGTNGASGKPAYSGTVLTGWRTTTLPRFDGTTSWEAFHA
ncbi:hypothetical protein EOD39_0424 [Acipenser ruthenus]|uniref:Uncharacterized protein n=1 Tax=Acipenser ruthenus TaxID=7906 RepID=A0A444U553_ACIRT|nr:hypothetical protein EOD39_0424 [Acipenser ruthenus]